MMDGGIIIYCKLKNSPKTGFGEKIKSLILNRVPLKNLGHSTGGVK